MIKERLNKQRQAPHVLVENKISFAAAASELSIYDTFEQATNIKLASDQMMFCGMVTGKKVMHASQTDYNSDFLPHESFVMAPNSPVKIDFPVATLNEPTTCIAIEITTDIIKKVCDDLNAQAPLTTFEKDWQYSHELLHTHHNWQTQALLERMVNIFSENHQDRSFLIDLAVRELITRLLRHQTREFIISHSLAQADHNGITAVVTYLHNHIKDEINIDDLCTLACMSRTKFFGKFKQFIGTSPQEFLFQLRLQHSAKLLVSNYTVTQACFASGYTNTSHFSRSFKSFYGLSPTQYKLRHCHCH